MIPQRDLLLPAPDGSLVRKPEGSPGWASTRELIELLKYSPDRFKNLVLNCILDEDICPRPDDNPGCTNAGDPKVLVEFIRWAKARYPADHYMVVLWGHGNGLSVAWTTHPRHL